MHNFGTNLKDGLYPNGVIRDASGNLYGTTASGGAPSCIEFKVSCGTVFRVDTAGRKTVIYNFPGGTGGQEPYAGLVMDASGSLYGTTVNGGAANAGVVYKLDTARHETVLHTFTGGADGASPYGGVILDAAGNLYGTTRDGGVKGHGVVYKLAASGQMTILHTFTGGADGGFPNGALARDASGNLYGSTLAGGIIACSKSPGGPLAGCGVIYKLDPRGNQIVLYSFTGASDGYAPAAGVIFDEHGNLYGTTRDGGTGGAGTLFELTPAGQKIVLHNFGGPPDGAGPLGSLARDSSGNFYGTTASGGSYDFGSIYKLTPAGVETVLYYFTGLGDWGGGGRPQAGVVLDSADNLYGTAAFGEPDGLVYELNSAGTYTILYRFSGGADGGYPNSNLILTPTGDLIGTAAYGGKMGGGVVFAIKIAAAR